MLLCAGCSHNTTRTCTSRSAGKNGSVDACSYIGTWPQNAPSSSLQADPGGDHGRLSHAWKGCSWAAMGLRSLPAPGASRVHSLAMLSLRSVTLLWDLLALIFVRNDDLLGKSWCEGDGGHIEKSPRHQGVATTRTLRGQPLAKASEPNLSRFIRTSATSAFCGELVRSYRCPRERSWARLSSACWALVPAMDPDAFGWLPMNSSAVAAITPQAIFEGSRIDAGGVYFLKGINTLHNGVKGNKWGFLYNLV